MHFVINYIIFMRLGHDVRRATAMDFCHNYLVTVPDLLSIHVSKNVTNKYFYQLLKDTVQEDTQVSYHISTTPTILLVNLKAHMITIPWMLKVRNINIYKMYWTHHKIFTELQIYG